MGNTPNQNAAENLSLGTVLTQKTLSFLDNSILLVFIINYKFMDKYSPAINITRVWNKIKRGKKTSATNVVVTNEGKYKVKQRNHANHMGATLRCSVLYIFVNNRHVIKTIWQVTEVTKETSQTED